MNYFGKKELKVLDLFFDHLNLVEETVKNLSKFIDEIKNKNIEEQKKLCDIIHKIESEADEKRRGFEILIYEGAFLPNFRGDLLELVEAFDKIANRCESLAEYFLLEKLKIPNELIDDLITLMDISYKTFYSAKNGAVELVNDTEKVEKHILNSRKRESLADDIELKIVKRIYDLDIQLAEKLQLGNFVKAIGDLADESENCTDIIHLALIKRMA